jgi:hypothetical protein
MRGFHFRASKIVLVLALLVVFGAGAFSGTQASPARHAAAAPEKSMNFAVDA